MIGVAGALLLTPGYFTDTLGFLLLVPPVRQALYAWLKTRFRVETLGRCARAELPRPATTESSISTTRIGAAGNRVRAGLLAVDGQKC